MNYEYPLVISYNGKEMVIHRKDQCPYFSYKAGGCKDVKHRGICNPPKCKRVSKEQTAPRYYSRGRKAPHKAPVMIEYSQTQARSKEIRTVLVCKFAKVVIKRCNNPACKYWRECSKV